MNILTLYYICYVILAMYMLDSDQEPSYILSKNLLLLPRILKLIEDIVDDSTSLYSFQQTHSLRVFHRDSLAENSKCWKAKIYSLDLSANVQIVSLANQRNSIIYI